MKATDGYGIARLMRARADFHRDNAKAFREMVEFNPTDSNNESASEMRELDEVARLEAEAAKFETDIGPNTVNIDPMGLTEEERGIVWHTI